MSTYKKMMLVAPEVIQERTPGYSCTSDTNTTPTTPPPPPPPPLPSATTSQEQYYDRQLAMQRVAPGSQLIQMLAHLQKEMARVLYDETMSEEARLATYNDLMTKSHIITDRVRYLGTEPALLGTPQTHQNTRPETIRKKVVAASTNMESAIQNIPKSYRHNVTSLYNHLLKSHQAKLHFTGDGRLILGVCHSH